MELIMAIFALLFTNNVVMSAVKWLADTSLSNTGLRALLVLFSFLGIIAAAAITGGPINFDSLSGLFKLLVETVALAIMSHFSYKTIKEA